MEQILARCFTLIWVIPANCSTNGLRPVCKPLSVATHTQFKRDTKKERKKSLGSLQTPLITEDCAYNMRMLPIHGPAPGRRQNRTAVAIDQESVVRLARCVCICFRPHKLQRIDPMTLGLAGYVSHAGYKRGVSLTSNILHWPGGDHSNHLFFFSVSFSLSDGVKFATSTYLLMSMRAACNRRAHTCDQQEKKPTLKLIGCTLTKNNTPVQNSTQYTWIATIHCKYRSKIGSIERVISFYSVLSIRLPSDVRSAMLFFSSFVRQMVSVASFIRHWVFALDFVCLLLLLKIKITWILGW